MHTLVFSPLFGSVPLKRVIFIIIISSSRRRVANYFLSSSSHHRRSSSSSSSSSSPVITQTQSFSLYLPPPHQSNSPASKSDDHTDWVVSTLTFNSTFFYPKDTFTLNRRVFCLFAFYTFYQNSVSFVCALCFSAYLLKISGNFSKTNSHQLGS